MPKDSLGIIELGTDNVWKKAAVKNFKTPDKSSGWVAYQAGNEKTASGEKNAAPGSDLFLRQLSDGKEKIFKNINEYYFNKSGRKLLMLTAKAPKDSLSKNYVLLYDLRVGVMDTLSRVEMNSGISP